MSEISTALSLENCPCQSGHHYADCCGKFHLKQAFPETAEQLMRSRYTAYVLKKYSLYCCNNCAKPTNFIRA